jgi:signal recognition particle subunit SRP54
MKQIMVGMAGKGMGERLKMARQLQESGMFNGSGRLAKQKLGGTGGLSATARAKMKQRRKDYKKKGKGKKKR